MNKKDVQVISVRDTRKNLNVNLGGLSGIKIVHGLNINFLESINFGLNVKISIQMHKLNKIIKQSTSKDKLIVGDLQDTALPTP